MGPPDTPSPPSFAEAFSVASLHRAYRRALRGHRQDKDAAAFALECGPRLCALSRALQGRRWRPTPARTYEIQRPKPRRIAVFSFADRVVHHALVGALEPSVDRMLDPDSYACRRCKGLHRAVRQGQVLMGRHRYALSLDIEHYFAAIAHAPVLALLGQRFGVSDDYLELLGRILGAEGPGGVGMPIGALTSQFVGNVGLDPCERVVRLALPGGAHIRYMDDLAIFADDKRALWSTRDLIAERAAAMGLTLKARATRLVPVTEGLTFCGYRIFAGVVRLRRAARLRLERAIRGDVSALAHGDGAAARLRAGVATRIEHSAWANDPARQRALVGSLALE